MARRQSTQILNEINELQRRPKAPKQAGIDWKVFGVAAALAIAFVAWGVISPDSVGAFGSSALTWVMDNFGWMFVFAASAFVVFVLWVALGKFGAIPLGKDGEAPKYRTSSWIAMMFATGMGIGLVFYGVGEPLFFYLSPPPLTADPASSEAIQAAMSTTIFHWTIYPWSMYAIVGLGMGYGAYRLGRSQLFSSMFCGLFGDKFAYSVGGKVINILAIFATLFGSACSLGLGALQIGGGMEAAKIVEKSSTLLLVAIIVFLTVCFVVSAVSGIDRGIQWLSNINMVLAAALALIVFIFGPTLFILNALPNSIATFVGDLPQLAGRTPMLGEEVSDWLSSWSVFYWAWWISWSPFVGMFIARISRGRTIRQFVTGVLLVPSVVSVLWFAIFGGGAIGIQRRAELANDVGGTIVAAASDLNFDMVLFDLLAKLGAPTPVTFALFALAVVLVAIFFVTGADSASIVMGGLSENGAEEPKRRLTIFWGVATGAAAAIMLVSGGDEPALALDGIKNITIVTALPFVVVMMLLMISITKDLSKDPLILRRKLARTLLEETVTEGVKQHDSTFTLRTAAVLPDKDLRKDPEKLAEAEAETKLPGE